MEHVQQMRSIQLLIIESQILHLVMAVQRSRNWNVQLSDRIVVDACWVHLLGLISEMGDLSTHVCYTPVLIPISALW